MNKNMKKVVAVVPYGDSSNRKSRWSQIGVAFENRDGSWNLKLDYIPADMANTTIQVRNFDPRGEEASDQPS